MSVWLTLMIFFLAFLSAYLGYNHSAINNAVIAVVQQLLTMGRLVVTKFFDTSKSIWRKLFC